jgi:K+ transporter
MTTWRKGRQLVAARIRRGEQPMQEVVDEAVEAHVARVPGIAVYLFKDEGAAPPALVSNLRHNHVLHDKVLLVSVHTEDVPRVGDEERAKMKDLGDGIWQVRFDYGFMEDPTSRSPCRSSQTSTSRNRSRTSWAANLSLPARRRACTRGVRNCSCSSTAAPPTLHASSSSRRSKCSKSAPTSRSE